MLARFSLFFTGVGVCLTLAALGVPAAAGPISVEEAVIASRVENLTPMGVGTIFSAAIGTLHCFSRVADAEAPTFIKHVWYYEGKRMADITLAIRSSRFRTYSSKRIMPAWTGSWRVEIVGADGTLLKTADFTIE